MQAITGWQPLFSYYYGKGEVQNEKKILKYAGILSLITALAVIGIANVFPENVVGIFNSERNPIMQELAVTGIRIYFIGMLFAGINIVVTGYLSAVGDSFWSAVISILRGIVVIIIVAVILAHVGKMDGVWSAFPVTECIVMVVSVIVLKNS